MFSIIGCGKNDLSQAGTYQHRENKQNVTILKGDGTFIVKQYGNEIRGTYKLYNGKLKLRINNGSTMRGKLENGVMYDNEGETWDKIN